MSDRLSKIDLIDALNNDKMYGFVEVDLEPTEKADKFLKLNFPPILRRFDVPFDWLPKWMQKNADEKTFPRRTILQAMRGEKLVFHTDLLKFYLENGFKITDLHKIFEYEPSKTFVDIYNLCYHARAEATGKDETKSTTIKLVSNSMYGSTILVSRKI